jgi:hypothetical protein
MARLIAHGAVLAVVFFAVHTAYAQEVPDEVVAVAAANGIDPLDLHGAVNTTHYDPATYLCLVGEGPCPKPAVPEYTVWDRLQSQCESPGGGWHTNTGNGYYGGVQMDMVFWRNYGGLQFASRPDLASREQQIVVAERGLAVQGWGAWPVCSIRLGLRSNR